MHWIRFAYYGKKLITMFIENSYKRNQWFALPKVTL